MTDLGPEARALLDRARDGLTPDPAALRRIRAKVAATTAGGAAAVGAASGGGAIGGGSAGGAALAMKLGVLAVLAAGTTAIVVTRTNARTSSSGTAASSETVSNARATPATPLAPTATPRASKATPPAPALPVEIAAPIVAAPIVVAPSVIATPVPAPAPAHASPARASHASAHAKRVAAPDDAVEVAAPPAPPVASLSREVELLDAAMSALRKGDNAAALVAVRRHAAETGGHGQLAEDAAAVEIEALCRLADPASAAKLDAFDARWPESAQRSRLTTACHR